MFKGNSVDDNRRVILFWTVSGYCDSGHGTGGNVVVDGYWCGTTILKVGECVGVRIGLILWLGRTGELGEKKG